MSKYGIPLDDNTILYTLSFTDDKIIGAQDVDDIECMTRKFVDEYEIWGLKVHIQKTEYRCIGGSQQDLQLSSGQSNTAQCTSTWR